METSIEITNDGKVHCEWVKEDAVKGFLMLFALTATEEDYKFFRMNKGMVNFNNKDVVISFGIELTPFSFDVNNLLSSLSFEETKNFIADIYGL